MTDFVQINGTFIRKSLIEVLEIEQNIVNRPDKYGIYHDEPADMFIIVDGVEYVIYDEDIDNWFKFIETWFDVTDYSEIREISGKLCDSAKSRGYKVTKEYED